MNSRNSRQARRGKVGLVGNYIDSNPHHVHELIALQEGIQATKPGPHRSRVLKGWRKRRREASRGRRSLLAVFGQ